MANIRSAKKSIRSDATKTRRNRSVRTSVRSQVSKARTSLIASLENLEVEEYLQTAEQQVRVAIKMLDRAAEKGILHANNVARRKGRLMELAADVFKAAKEGSADTAAAVRAAAVGGTKGKTTASTVARKPATTKTTAAKTTAKATTAKKTTRKATTSKTKA
jgi:small subunit ribosomal protein S20